MPRPSTPPADLVPLSPAVAAILTALADGPKHGYAIMKESGEAAPPVRMGPGTLYGSLDRMLAAQLIQETGASDDERRRYYTITPFGLRVLAAQAAHLRASLATLRRKGIRPAPETA